MPRKHATPDHARLDRVVADARRQRELREAGYREQALKLFPWICGRCGCEFSGTRLRELTVHHKDHNHDNNPADGSNWELLCLYCHDNEHARLLDEAVRDRGNGDQPAAATHNPFAGLQTLLKKTFGSIGRLLLKITWDEAPFFFQSGLDRVPPHSILACQFASAPYCGHS